MIASVPLTDEGWIPFAEGEVVALKMGRVLTAQPADARLGDAVEQALEVERS
jgi:hypothetical protein